MNWLEALILGILQGLTEFLPVSSSGHLEIGKNLFGIHSEESIYFTIAVHGATVLSTIVVFWKDIVTLFKGVFKVEWNEETQYTTKILVSMIPVGIVGVFFKDDLKSLFTGENIVFVGIMLLITATLLAFTFFSKSGKREVTFRDAFIIGIAQAFAVLPGISRSGSTIATGLLLGNNKETIAKFSFLMVLLPIIGENMLDVFSGEMTNSAGLGLTPIIIGFAAAFFSGLLACKWMINLVKRGKLIYFAIYCFSIGLIAIIFG